MVIWRGAVPDSFEGECPPVNKYGTYSVFIFGFANWPWILNLFCWKSTESNHDMFVMPLIIGVIISAGYLASHYFGDFLHLESGSQETCSYYSEGVTQYLGWNFNMSRAHYFPNNFFWFLSVLLPLSFYKPVYPGVAFLSYGVISFVVPKVFLTWNQSYSMY